MTEQPYLSPTPSEQPVVQLHDLLLRPEPKRTVLRPFEPGDVPGFSVPGGSRTRFVIDQILALGPTEVATGVETTLEPLRHRHRDADATFRRQYEAVADRVPDASSLSEGQRLLIGAYFSEEYAFESAALFNPSIVRHPDHDGGSADTRFVLSLRGIGEGHLSSLAFRTGTWKAGGDVVLDEASPFAVGPSIRREDLPNGRMQAHLECDGAGTLAETVVYPFLPSQGRGIEDMRLVQFTDDDGVTSYRGTFTAFSGTDVRQGLIETRDFRRFEMRGVEGDLYAGKGMALFPRRVGGRYAMLSRQDNRSLFLVYSDDPYRWSGGDLLLEPRFGWEWMQIGNCGSPIELDEGWLVLTHGVGAVRTYCMGAALLDKADPSRVLGRLAQPLLEPTDERDGYVPNVVYSCGALLRGRELLLPFAVADSFTRFATVDVDRLLGLMATT